MFFCRDPGEIWISTTMPRNKHVTWRVVNPAYSYKTVLFYVLDYDVLLRLYPVFQLSKVLHTNTRMVVCSIFLFLTESWSYICVICRIRVHMN